MYKDALDAKIFPSQQQMAMALNVSRSALGTAILLASLPDEIVNAFPSPLDLQFRWAAAINKALHKDGASVVTTANKICEMSPRPSSREVFNALVGSASGLRFASPVSEDIKIGSRLVGTFSRDAKGAVKLRLNAGVLTADGEQEFKALLFRLAV